jgi:hypothetical protein
VKGFTHVDIKSQYQVLFASPLEACNFRLELILRHMLSLLGLLHRHIVISPRLWSPIVIACCIVLLMLLLLLG